MPAGMRQDKEFGQKIAPLCDCCAERPRPLLAPVPVERLKELSALPFVRWVEPPRMR